MAAPAPTEQLSRDLRFSPTSFVRLSPLADLKVLTEAGLVDRERRGTHIFYRINQGLVEELLGHLLELLGTGAATPETEE